MPFYIRKSVSAGPFRFNFSKSGLGVSVGVKGLRIGTGPRGHYIHAGQGGLYYRATLGRAGQRRSPGRRSRDAVAPTVLANTDDPLMIEVESGDVMHMRDESFSEILDEINEKAQQVRMSVALFWVSSAIGIIAMLALGGLGILIWASIAVVAVAVGRWLDSYRRTTVLYYDLESDAETAYSILAEGFDALSGCAGKWHIEAGGAIENLTAWKRNAGASHLVRRKPTTLAFKLPSVVKSNLNPPALHVGRQILFFMPDILLVQDGGRLGAVSYSDLNLRWQDSRFIEAERVPGDARIVDHTWQHPNKSGGPDRRFKDNRQIPICLYETMYLTSANGLNELVEFSRTGVVAGFEEGRRMLAGLSRHRSVGSVLTPANDTVGVPTVHPTKQPAARTGRGLVVIGLLACAGLLVNALLSSNGGSTSGPLASVSSAPSASRMPDETGPAPDISRLPVAPQPIEAVADVEKTEPTSLIDAGTARNALRYTTTDVNLRSGPGRQFAVAMVVPGGTEVLLVEAGRGWSRVRVGEDRVGWISNSTFEER
ncbi:DUF4236 domain-containing protein [Devosia sp. WQ 349]|nr:DUF4236 domain-containing protein [Devosia sp. WQ 349K1]